ncbi:DUF4181 domain-containing protein [uncultured Planococcus sp.]|uniref:DUF4181 domain-containing protein n=1 Tax=uncultured Planococcus sp. TaxID=337815 RepID=UPI002603ABE3|nr:DUF4181 domain-containing protein [uncultured Planococcus sp.]
MDVLLIWLAIIFGFGFLRIFLRKRFGIDEEERAGIQVRRFERWNGWVMLGAIIVLFMLLPDSLEVFFSWLMIVFLIVNGVQVFLEWKYLQESRKYQVSLIYFAITVLAVVLFISYVGWQIG